MVIYGCSEGEALPLLRLQRHHKRLTGCLRFTSLCLQRKHEVSYVVEGEGLHGLVLLQGVQLVQVAVGDEHGSVLRLVEMVDLTDPKLSIRRFTQTPAV